MVMTDAMLHLPQHLPDPDVGGETSEQMCQCDPTGLNTSCCPSSEQRMDFTSARMKDR